MQSKYEAQANQILQNAGQGRKRYSSWEERLHPELIALEPHAKKELLERARLEANASIHLLWQLVLGVSILVLCIVVLQPKLGAFSGGLGISSSWLVVMCIRHWHIYRATREALRRFQLLERAARGEA